MRKIRRMSKPKREICYYVNGMPVYKDEGEVNLNDTRFKGKEGLMDSSVEGMGWDHRRILVSELTEQLRREGRLL